MRFFSTIKAVIHILPYEVKDQQSKNQYITKHTNTKMAFKRI
jgi:hypothetical protein